MNVIHKQELDGVGASPYELPIDAEVLKVGFQKHRVMLWYLTDPVVSQGKTTKFIFEVVGTGMLFDATGKKHIGTAVSDDWVWHVFQLR
jgi:hypothetical protein